MSDTHNICIVESPPYLFVLLLCFLMSRTSKPFFSCCAAEETKAETLVEVNPRHVHTVHSKSYQIQLFSNPSTLLSTGSPMGLQQPQRPAQCTQHPTSTPFNLSRISRICSQSRLFHIRRLIDLDLITQFRPILIQDIIL